MGVTITHQATDWDFIEAGQGPIVLTRHAKAVRIDQTGTATILPESGELRPVGNYLQGEVLNMQGKLTITTGTARVQVYY